MLLLEFRKVHPILEIKQLFTSALESNWENTQGNCEQHGMLPVVKFFYYTLAQSASLCPASLRQPFVTFVPLLSGLALTGHFRYFTG